MKGIVNHYCYWNSMALSKLNNGVLRHILDAIHPGVQTEVRFHGERRWRFDYAWPEHKIAFEVEGGAWTNGRHVRGKGYENDCVKYSEAAIHGWTVIRATTGMCSDGRAVELLEKAFKKRGL